MSSRKDLENMKSSSSFSRVAVSERLLVRAIEAFLSKSFQESHQRTRKRKLRTMTSTRKNKVRVISSRLLV